MCVCVCVWLFADVVNEQLEDFKDSGRFEETDDNLAIFTIKERAIEVIDLVFNFRFYVRLQVRTSWLNFSAHTGHCFPSHSAEVYL